MIETKAIQTVRKVVEKVSLIKRKRDAPVSEHPDLLMIRRHRAAEAAIKNLESLKTIGRFETRRS